MELCDINPYMRYAELQPSVMSSAPLSCSYDYRIFYIVEGMAKLVLEDRSIDLYPGTLLYFRPGTPYYFDGKVKVFVLNFDMTRNQSDKKTPVPPSKSVKTFESEMIFENDPPDELSELIVIDKAFDIRNRIQECIMHYRYPTPFSDAYSSAILKELLCFIAKAAKPKELKVPKIVRRITLYIQQNYDKDISNSQISSEFGYHSFYLNRIFKKNTGVTLHQAVMIEKMRVAKRLLKETDLSVNSVATEAGFFDRSQFCTAFRKYTGYTPTEYREK